MLSDSNFVNCARQEDKLTENGCVTNSTSLNSVVDLFFIGGASRNLKDKDVEIKLQKSFLEDPNLTLKCIFYLRDIREGQGERRFFRIALNWLEKQYPSILEKIISFVPEYGRWDDIFELKTNTKFDLIKKALSENNGLCAKWLPRDTSKKYKKFIEELRQYLELTPKQYRKKVVELTKVIESQMCKNEWDKINYEQTPSQASNRYRKAFYKHDEQRYLNFVKSVNKGEKKINAGAIYPYEIYRKIKSSSTSMNESIIAQWNNLPNYISSNKRILPICDVSGSMTGTPMDISVSLGIYISERNKSVFKDAFITFSCNPKMEYLKGNLIERTRQLERAEWDSNTNIEAVFKLIYTIAKKNRLTQEDMPTDLLIISDMEFDSCAAGTSSFDMMKAYYAEMGYILPNIIFWNVNAHSTENIPVKFNQNGVALVSGSSPSILKTVLSDEIDPEGIVKKTLLQKRYEVIKID